MRRLAPQVDPTHYLRGYDSPGRFASYWYQVEEAVRLGGRVVEIGFGNGTVTAALRARGLEVTTVDLDPELGPDVVGDIRQLPFPAGSFDTVLAAEVLEHLPWAEVGGAITEIARVAIRGAVVSVPDREVALSIMGRIPNALQITRLGLQRRVPVRLALWALLAPVSWRRGGHVRAIASIDPLHPSPRCDQHYWELGLGGVRRDNIIAMMEKGGLRVARDYRVLENPYHHLFIGTVA